MIYINTNTLNIKGLRNKRYKKIINEIISVDCKKWDIMHLLLPRTYFFAYKEEIIIHCFLYVCFV